MAVRRCAERRTERKEADIIITLTSHKGGVGKSTSAVHLAAFMSGEFGEENVALVDTDPNRSSLEWAARGGEGSLPFRVLGDEEEVQEEHVIYDSQGRLHDEDLVAAARASDLLVVPTTPDFLALNALGRFLEDLDDVGGAFYKVLLTMVPWYEKLYSPGRSELEAAGVPVFRRHVQHRKAFQHAADRGLPVYEIKGKAAEAGWREYRQVGEELVREVLR